MKLTLRNCILNLSINLFSVVGVLSSINWLFILVIFFEIKAFFGYLHPFAMQYLGFIFMWPTVFFTTKSIHTFFQDSNYNTYMKNKVNKVSIFPLNACFSKPE